jgi:AraC-like DNA-binding protein
VRPTSSPPSIEQSARGLVNPTVAAQFLEVDRAAPAADLAWAVEYHWMVRWRVPEVFAQRVVPQPSIHVTFEPEGAFITGVATGDWTRELRGDGCVLGVKFRAGGFRPFLEGPVRALTDRVVPLRDVFGPGVDAVVEEAMAHIARGEPAAVVPVAEGWLRTLPTGPRALSVSVSTVVEWVVASVAAGEPAMRVGAVAETLGVTVRQLQRVFADVVGVSPKWVIDRARILEAGERVRRDPGVRLADLAAELGFADQAHLSRSFAAAVGESPARYASTIVGRSN